MSQDYFLNTGELDKKRLSILSGLYNPPALQFLKNSGLKPGMTILEIGCGSGHMACDLAKYLGSSGKVIAIDSSTAQIEVAKETADEQKISNIDFFVCDVLKISELGLEYDATYGRWVIEFLPDPFAALKAMYDSLKQGGILAYEGLNMKETAYFTAPYSNIAEKYHSWGSEMFAKNGCGNQVANNLYPMFMQLHCHDIDVEASQAILKTPKEKSVYRLGALSAAKTLIDQQIKTQDELEAFIEDLKTFEQQEAISGFYRNLLISGIK